MTNKFKNPNIKFIYYAHSMEIYNTKIEKKEFDTIYDKFQNENIYIINPATWIAQNMNGHDAMQQCFKFIDISDCIVFTTLEDGIIGKGVYEEISYALKNKKKIFILKDDMIIRFLNIHFKKIDIIYNKTSSTWKRYAKVCE